MPVGLVINHNDPTVGFILFQSAKHVSALLEVVGTIEWMGTHMEIDFEKIQSRVCIDDWKVVRR